MTTRFVPAGSHRLALSREGAGRPAVLIHGWMCDRADMASLAADLAADHEVVTVDLRGHGESEAPAAGFGLEDFADDAAAVIEYLGLGPSLIVGHSMGGAVALTLAGRRPDLVGGVVAVDAPWAVTPPGEELRARTALLHGAEFAARRDRLRAARAALLPGPLAPATAQPVAAGSYASLMAWDGPAALRGCPRPLHAVFADGGWATVTPDLPRFPGLRTTHVPGTGHWVQLERPDAVAAAVRTFAGALT